MVMQSRCRMCILQVKGGYSLSLLWLREYIKESWVGVEVLGGVGGECLCYEHSCSSFGA